MSTYNTAELRRQNRSRVFRYIFASQNPVIKQDIAHALSLSLPTVGQNLKELQQSGLLETQGTFSSTGGRKPRAIGIAAGVRCAVGVMISAYHIHMSASTCGQPALPDLHRLRLLRLRRLFPQHGRRAGALPGRQPHRPLPAAGGGRGPARAS